MSPATLVAGSTHALEPFNVQSVHTGAAVHWQNDDLTESPSWFDSLVPKLYAFSQLPAGWDSYNAPAINDVAIAASVFFAALVQSLSPTAAKPSLGPTAEGFIQFEWRSADLALEVEVQQGGRLEYGIFRNNVLVDEGSVQPEAYPRVASLVGGLFG